MPELFFKGKELFHNHHPAVPHRPLSLSVGLVFAAARFVSQRILNDEHLNVELAPVPFALYRVERS